MADCEMCGSNKGSLVTAKVEGTNMRLCSNCVKYGTQFADTTIRSKNSGFSRPKRAYVDPDANKVLIKSYPSIIKSARENKGLKQSEVAKQLNEKESLIHSIESGSLRPSFKTARKLEKFFKISLIEEIPGLPENQPSQKEEVEPLTMGDILKKALKKK